VTEATAPPARAESRPGFRIVLGLLGTCLLVLIFVWVGPRAIADQLSKVGPRALWILAPYVVGTAIGAFPWTWLLPSQERPTVRGTIASRFAASGANALLPFFGLAGEPLRLLWLASDARARGLAAIVVDRVVYNSANALLLLVGACFALSIEQLPRSVGISGAAIALAIGAITIGIARSAAHLRIGDRLHGVLKKRIAALQTTRDFGAEVDASLRELLGGQRRRLWPCLVTHLAGRAALCAEVYVALWTLGAAPSVSRAFVLATVPIATGLVASSIPSQIGVQEAAQAFTCAALGIPPAVGFSLVLLQRARQLAFIPLTPFLVSTATGTPFARRQPT
jgi:lysylphosphatidylglycerol synthase-like protein